MRHVLKLLQAVIFSLFFANSLQAGEPQKGIATLDWTVAETLIALGETPVAVGDVESYKKWVKFPTLPQSVKDLGIRLQPNSEQLVQLSHSLEAQPLQFINTSFYAAVTPQIEKFAEKVEMVDFYQEGDAWQNILNASEKIAELIEKPAAFQTLKQNYLQKIEEIRPLVAPYTARPIALVQFIDTRHLRIYATNSPFGAVLSQLGFHNAWQGSQNHWGFEVIEVTQLAKLPENSRFVIVKPYPHNIASALKYNIIWQHLAMAKDPLILPEVWTFGGIPSAQRFAETLANGLLNGGEPW
ncbi:MAG: iron-siderophore ABC transporter substrate-binding protein [Mannheimia varigena]|nr:iron-siderophore ABC transporter substrate-binding protein [Mannheimia varigena]